MIYPGSLTGATSNPLNYSRSDGVALFSVVLANGLLSIRRWRAEHRRCVSEGGLPDHCDQLAAAGYANGATPTSIGWNYATGQAGSAPLKVYLQNTADTTNTKNTTWTTTISGMTLVHNGSYAVPASGPVDVTFTGGSPFTYTGGGLYIAIDWGNFTGTRALLVGSR